MDKRQRHSMCAREIRHVLADAAIWLISFGDLEAT